MPHKSYNRFDGENNGTPWWYFFVACCGCIFVAAAIIALIFSSINLVRTGDLLGHDHPKPFGEMAINKSTPVPFDVNTTCMPLSGFDTHHAEGLVVGDAYIEAPKDGVYWFSISALVSFGDHFFLHTPWSMYTSVNGMKRLNEGQARDVAWYSVLNETHFSSFFVNWPLFPHTPADMRMTNLIELKAGDKFGIMIGFPEYCKFCGLIEQSVHGPGNITVESARAAIRMFHEATSSAGRNFASAAVITVVGLLLF